MVGERATEVLLSRPSPVSVMAMHDAVHMTRINDIDKEAKMLIR